VEVRCMTRRESWLFLAFDVVGARLLLTTLENLMMMREEEGVCSVRCLIHDHVCLIFTILPRLVNLPKSIKIEVFKPSSILFLVYLMTPSFAMSYVRR